MAVVLIQGIEETITMFVEDYYDLHAYSVSDYNFWLDLWEFLGIRASVPPTTVSFAFVYLASRSV
jgi:hypothetical protein